MGGQQSERVQRRNRTAVGVIVVMIMAGVVGCSWIGGDSQGEAPEPTLEGGMRTVPTVPTSASVDTPGAEVTNGAEEAAAIDPADTGVPTTVYVGDVAGGDSETLPPPETIPGQTPQACVRLADYAAADLVGVAGGAPAATESIWDGACRMTAGAVVAEVHYVPEATVLDDWYRREGIEPVGEIGGDAVGLDGFLAPGSDPTDGFTIALVNARQGVVVAVSGSDVPRDLAVALATAAGQSTR
jgi:hypothetical protein